MATSRVLCHVYASCTIMLWASSYVATKLVTPFFSPAAVSLSRCVVASLTLGVILMVKRIGLPKLADVPKFFLSGALGFGVYFLLFNKAFETLNPTTGCIVTATCPVMTALFASLRFKETLPVWAWLAMAIEFSGILVLTLWNGVLDINVGVFWMLASAACFSAYTLLQREYTQTYSALQMAAYSFFTASILLIIFVPQTWQELQAAGTVPLALLLYLGVLPSGAGILLWAKAATLARNTSEVANYMFLTPLLAFVMGYFILDDTLDTGTLAGGALIFCGLILFNTAGKKQWPATPKD